MKGLFSSTVDGMDMGSGNANGLLKNLQSQLQSIEAKQGVYESETNQKLAELESRVTMLERALGYPQMNIFGAGMYIPTVPRAAGMISIL